MTQLKRFPAVIIVAALLLLVVGTMMAAAAPTPGQGQQVPPGQPVPMPGQQTMPQPGPGQVPPPPAANPQMNLLFWQTVHDYTSKLVTPQTADDVFAKTRKVYAETPNYGFFLFLVPDEMKGQKMTLDTAVTHILDLPEIKSDSVTRVVMVIYMVSTNEYKIIMDEGYRNRANLALVQSIMDEQFVTKMKEGKSNDAVAAVVPRLVANYALFLRNADKVDQSLAKPAGYTIRPTVFGFKKPAPPPTPPPVVVPKAPPPPESPWYTSWWLIGTVLLILCGILGFRFWQRYRENNSHEWPR